MYCISVYYSSNIRNMPGLKPDRMIGSLTPAFAIAIPWEKPELARDKL